MFNKNNQLTVGDLKELLKNVKDDVSLYVGYGCNVAPLVYLDDYSYGIMFHPDLYMENPKIKNLATVSIFFKE